MSVTTENELATKRGHHLDAAREGTLKGIPTLLYPFDPASINPNIMARTHEVPLLHMPKLPSMCLESRTCG